MFSFNGKGWDLFVQFSVHKKQLILYVRKIKIDGNKWKLILTIIFYIRWRNAVEMIALTDLVMLTNQKQKIWPIDQWVALLLTCNDPGTHEILYHWTRAAAWCLMFIRIEILCILSLIDEYLMDEGTNCGKLNLFYKTKLKKTKSLRSRSTLNS